MTPYTHCVQVWVELAELEATEYIGNILEMSVIIISVYC
jgi:hypothetical protein